MAKYVINGGRRLEGTITINGAKACGIEDRVGSIKVGKDADIVVFTGHPFHYLTKTTAVFINGKRED